MDKKSDNVVVIDGVEYKKWYEENMEKYNTLEEYRCINCRRSRKEYEAEKRTEQDVIEEWSTFNSEAPNLHLDLSSLLRQIFHPTDEELSLELEVLSRFEDWELSSEKYPLT